MGDGPEDVHGRSLANTPSERVVFHCDLTGGDHPLHHQYFERLDGTVADIVWAAESDRAQLTRASAKEGSLSEHDDQRSQVVMANPRIAQARKRYPNQLDANKKKAVLVPNRVSIEDL